MKNKLICRFVLCALLLSMTGFDQVLANDSSKGVQVNYSAPIKNISIKGPSEIIIGTSNSDFSAFLDGVDEEADVTWTIKNATSVNTVIDATGKLQVGIDEKAENLIITAVYRKDPTKTANINVKVIEKTYTIVSVEKKADITMAGGTTQEDLKSKISDEVFKVEIETNDGKRYTINVDKYSYKSLENMINQKGVLIPGTYELEFLLTLPYIEIDEKDKVVIDNNRNTNIKGEAKSLIKVIVEESVNNVPSKPSKPVTGTNTGDISNESLYATILFASSLFLLWLMILFLKKFKEEKAVEKIN